jgi:hypothetical protein
MLCILSILSNSKLLNRLRSGSFFGWSLFITYFSFRLSFYQAVQLLDTQSTLEEQIRGSRLTEGDNGAFRLGVLPNTCRSRPTHVIRGAAAACVRHHLCLGESVTSHEEYRALQPDSTNANSATRSPEALI